MYRVYIESPRNLSPIRGMIIESIGAGTRTFRSARTYPLRTAQCMAFIVGGNRAVTSSYILPAEVV